jgi:hypothetical protein
MARAPDVYAQSNTSPHLSAIPAPISTQHTVRCRFHSQESSSTFISPGNLRFTDRNTVHNRNEYQKQKNNVSGE